MEQLPALLIIVPMLIAPLCVLVRQPTWSWGFALFASLSCTVVSLKLMIQVSAEGAIRYALGGWAAPTGIEYYVDAANAPILVLVSLLSAVALVYAYHSVRKSIDTSRHYLFYTAWILCVTGLLGMSITGDIFNVFVFLEISSLSTYSLIAFGQDRRALTASFRYLILGSVGASFILIGIAFLYAATGTLNMVDLAERIPQAESTRAILVAFSFLTIGLMIKTAVFPLHAWLANAYHYAPVAVTVFLAGTATKVSLYVLLRVFLSIFTPEYSFGVMVLNAVLLPTAVLAFVLMSLVAVFQTDMRRMLAYSSVAQIGYIVAGIAIGTQAGVTAGYAHIINHAIIKSTLFMSVGCVLYRVGHTHAPSVDRLFTMMPLSVIAFLLAGLGLIGVPLTAGFVSKFTLIGAAMDQGWWMVSGLVLVSSLMATLYIGRVVQLMLFRKGRKVAAEPVVFNEAPKLMLIAMYTLLAIGLWLGINGSFVLNLSADAARVLIGGYP
ncbi:MAG: monovalent cation/H+ antiporter subunit D family protein [Gammaproteobacteria bacterium]|nr:monovalent cation/H+ antiporter subunit D family protein [Gammaproteobacteria bacterium]